jgi:hypothetical protein
VSDRRPGHGIRFADVSDTARNPSPQDQFYLAATEFCLLAARYLSQLIEEDEQDESTTASQSCEPRGDI